MPAVVDSTPGSAAIAHSSYHSRQTAKRIVVPSLVDVCRTPSPSKIVATQSPSTHGERCRGSCTVDAHLAATFGRVLDVAHRCEIPFTCVQSQLFVATLLVGHFALRNDAIQYYVVGLENGHRRSIRFSYQRSMDESSIARMSVVRGTVRFPTSGDWIGIGMVGVGRCVAARIGIVATFERIGRSCVRFARRIAAQIVARIESSGIFAIAHEWILWGVAPGNPRHEIVAASHWIWQLSW